MITYCIYLACEYFGFLEETGKVIQAGKAPMYKTGHFTSSVISPLKLVNRACIALFKISKHLVWLEGSLQNIKTVKFKYFSNCM